MPRTLRSAALTVALFLCLGLASAAQAQVSFTAAPLVATGDTPVSVALGDLNGGGNLDLVVVNNAADTVSILLGNGDGTFTAAVPATVATGFTPVFIALGDLDGDGNLDLVVANRLSAGPPTVSVLLGNGNGTFEPKTDFTTGNIPVSVALGDLDGDGDLDIAVANEADNTVSILLNTPAAAPPAPGGGGGGGCFIATAAFGSALAPQVQLLRDFRDRFLLPHTAGSMFVELYYALSPPLAEVIAGSETLRAIVRVGLLPIIGWAAILLWSPTLGLGILVMALGFGGWLALWMAQQSRWAGARRRVPRAGKVTRSYRTTLGRRPALWGCVIFVLSAATIVEASPGREIGAPVKLVADVRLPAVSRFALIQDHKSGHVALYTAQESIHIGENPLPIGKIAAMDHEVLVLAFPGGQTIEIPQGGRLPGPGRLVFIRSALIDTLRYQIRFGAAATPSSRFSVVDVLGRRAILQRDAIPGEGKATTSHPPHSRPQRPLAASMKSSSVSERGALAQLVDRIPFDEVAPDTWEIPGTDVKQLGNHLGPLFTDAFRSAAFIVDTGWGVGLRVNTALGMGTLDRRGFLIEYAKLANRTGLEVGDRILSVNNQPVNSAGGLVSLYRKLQSDPNLSEVKVVITRNNQPRTLTYRIR